MRKKFNVLLMLLIVASLLLSLNSFAAEKTHKLEFNNEDEDTNAKDILDLTDIYEVKYGTGSCAAIVTKGEGDNNYLALSGYIDISSIDLYEVPYTYSLDVQMIETGNVGFFVRGVLPVTRYNAAHSGGMDMVVSYYEADWYVENQGKNGPTMIGGSGIAVFPLDTGIRVNIKTFETDGLKMGNKFYDFPLPEGFDITKFFNLKFVDSGDKVQIFINNNILATIEISEKGVYEEDEEDTNEYLKKAVVKDAQGTEVLSLNNARISAGVSQVAIGCRNKKINVDNISLTFVEPDPTPTPVPTPTPDKTVAPTATKVTPNVKTTSESGGLSNTLIMAIVAAVLVIGVVTAVLVILSKKKK